MHRDADYDKYQQACMAHADNITCARHMATERGVDKSDLETLGMGVRRQSFWDRRRLKLRESLAR